MAIGPIIGDNATGWKELMEADLVGAVFQMYNTAFVGWFVVILFFVYQFMLIMKTRNLTVAWVTGIFFASMYAATNLAIIKPMALQVMGLIMVLELAGILYIFIWK